MERSSDSKRKAIISAPSGKLAFSLKPKSKLIAPPVKFDGDDEEDEIEVGNLVDRSVKRQKATQSNVLQQPSKSADFAPSAPSDPTVKKVADKLASFVAKNGRQFEHVTCQKNPGDTPFKFLFDESCADYKYYEYRLNEEERVLSRTSNNGSTIKVEQTPNGYLQKANYQIPASALYESTDSVAPGGANASSSADPVAMMEFYMKKAAQEEKRKLPKHSKDEMPPPASLQGSDKKGHHMGDYIPPEELEKFMSACNDAEAQKASKEAAERAKIQADNVGHKLLSKMGWREGEGLGSSKNGIANTIMAGNVKKDTLGVGASQPGEVTPDDDIYEQYKKRMMLGYRHRPNPLVGLSPLRVLLLNHGLPEIPRSAQPQGRRYHGPHPRIRPAGRTPQPTLRN